ncbi:MAG: molybdopterin-dependent oxidoreductase [Desulfohalobiaceae bacterium]|nr:molybdopterin-dependent oxidoreductase [Desulfohalobiaceae bacterium]
MPEEIYSLCFMCTVRCPIKVSVEKGRVAFIEGSPHVPDIAGSLCPKGAAGKALLNDQERVQGPMIRSGPRGSGKWRRVKWEEALDYVADKLKKNIEKHGGRSVVLGERANLASHVSKTFLKAIGSPNYFSHDALCKGSVNTACRSLFGLTDGQLNTDNKNARQIILYGRNIYESIALKPMNQLNKALENGARLTYIDPRVSVTASKAHRFWMIRPKTDLALNYALMHVIIKENLYDEDFVQRWVLGFDRLQEFVQPYTPEWAEAETGIRADEIRELAREAGKDRPRVVFHHGYRGAHYTNEIHLRRSILILNCLMGNIETPGGLFFKKGPGEAGGKPARKLTDQDLPTVDEVRFDKVGTPDFPLPDPNHGVGQMLPAAILEEDPYPLTSLIAYRFDPLMSIPDTTLTRKALDKLDLVVAIDINYSDIAAYADVILPEPIYLERLDCVQQANSLKPQMFLRQQAVKPRFDTMPGAMILKEIGKRLGLGQYFPYESMEELVDWQLEPTGFTREEFKNKGFVSYSSQQIFWDREDGLKFKTPSGKIEFVSSLLEEAGYESFPEYTPVETPEEADEFRLIEGRCALHTHVSTQNNPYLNELMSENVLWINDQKGAALGISDGQLVEVASDQGSGRLKAKVTPFIHPECVFLIHGFGHQAQQATRSFQKGVSDALLQQNVTDRVGGSPGLHETFVRVKPLG